MRGASRVRSVGAVLALGALLAMLGPACDQGSASPSPSVTSTTRPQSLASAMGRAPASDSGDGRADELIDRADEETPGPSEPAPEPTPTTAPITLVDRAEIEEQLPDLGYVQRCVEVGAAYAKLHLLALDGVQGQKEALASTAQFKAFLPPSLHDEIDTVAGAIATVAGEGPLESAALESGAYNGANAALAGYFDDGCPA